MRDTENLSPGKWRSYQSKSKNGQADSSDEATGLIMRRPASSDVARAAGKARVTSRDPGPVGGSATQGIAEGAIDHLPSWEQIRADFLEAATAYPDVSARWEPREELWTLRDTPVGEAEKSAKRDAQQFFTEEARIAVTLLGASSEGKQAWHVWLDLMRKEKGYFRRDKKPRDWVATRTIS